MTNYCNCGCGNLVNNKWKKGHNPKVSLIGDKNPMKYPQHYKKFWEATHSEEYKELKSKQTIGKNNPMFGRKRPEITGDNNPMKNPIVKQKHLEKMRSKERREQHSKLMKGKNNPNWKENASKEKYEGFGKHTKKKILLRDNFTCQLCNSGEQRLDVHHINYNKTDSNESNLITLCKICHGKSHYNREYYIDFYMKKLSRFIEI